MNCSHISRVKEWGFDDNHDFIASLWDCVLCGLESSEPFRQEEVIINHDNCGEDCFGCKAKGLQLSTGDANAQKSMSNKSWNSELDAYRAARAQGIQPAGTSMAKIREAEKASEVMGKAYDANTMTQASAITKQSVGSLKDAGVI